MRKLINTFLCWLVPVLIFGQEYSGPAKTYLAQFNKAMDKLEALKVEEAAFNSTLKSAEGHLKNIKKTDPSFDVRTLENKFNEKKKLLDEYQDERETIRDVGRLNDKMIEMRRIVYPEIGSYTLEQLEKYATGDAEEALRIFKKKHPDYYTENFEKEIADFKEKFMADAKARQNANSEEWEVTKQIKMFLGVGNLNYPVVSKESDIEKSRTACYNFIAEADEFVTYIRSHSSVNVNGNTSVADVERNLDSWVNQSQKEFDAEKENLNSSREVSGFTTFFKIKMKMKFWEAASVAFPSNTTYALWFSKYKELVESNSDEAKLKQQIQFNYSAYLKTVKFPAATHQNDKLESLFKSAFEKTGWNEELVKINLGTREWFIEKDNLGNIVGRTQSAYIGAKDKNGDCVLYYFSIIQYYANGNYETNAVLYSHRSEPIACENIK